MSNPIPPFVCSTPPPIDCIADAPPPLVEDDFGDFAVVDEHQFEVSSLPVTPVHVAKLPDIIASTDDKTTSPPPLPDSVYDFLPEDKITSTTIETNSFTKENSTFYPPSNSSVTTNVNAKNDLTFIIEAHSPPPFEYAVEDDVELPPCVALDDDDVDIDDVPDEFAVDDDMAKYEDNISLPSLKFDSLSNHSKSTTPVSAEELAKPMKVEEEPVTAPDVVEDVESGSVAALEIEPEAIADEELNTIPIESLNLQDESSLRQSSEEQEDDFAEFEGFPVSASEDAPQQATTESAAFEADFSQFSSFATEAVALPQVASQITSQVVEKSALDDLEADDFDDFQDFAVTPTAASTIEQRKASVNSASSEMDQPEASSETITKNSDEDDDDFGEFSEVVETKTTTTTSNIGFNLANLNEKLKPILEMMFPFASTKDNDDDQEKEFTPSALNDLNQLTAIKQIDTAKALDHQWINSEVRHSLIKSLGVDSRNILYGEKWNSSMPRYAANLSFNPLEPMKSSDKSTTNNNSSLSSSSANTIDYRKRCDDSSSTKTDVPAVEFDWNSSGLVNPLDGVKEILHEGTLETFHPTESGQSNQPIDQQSSSTLKSNTTTTTTITTPINDNIKVPNTTINNNIYDSDKSLRCFIDDIEEAIPTASEFKSNADASIAIPTATPTATTNIIHEPSSTTTAALSGDYINITGGEFQSSGVLETNLDPLTATTTTMMTTSEVLNHNTITHAAKYQEILKTDHLETESSHSHSGVVSTSTFSGPLKETHIYTPSKANENIHSSKMSSNVPIKTQRTSSESKCPIDFDYEIAAAGIIIDETVVKKEYRDVEYNPGFGSKYREEPIEHTHHRLTPEIGISKHNSYGSDFVQSRESPRNPLDDVVVKATKPSVPTSSSFDDEFSDFQSVPPPAAIPTIVPSTIIPSSSVITEPKTSPSHWRVLKETPEISSLSSRTGTPVSLNDEMILCPAILIPQAIQLENKENKPKIEWPEPGINPEELARIEELFPQPKTNNSNKPSPSHSIGGRSLQQNASNRATPQLSAASPATNDDDDWSDFVSVPAAAPNNHIQSISQQFQKTKNSPAKSNVAADSNSSYDDEWSDFVSSAPPPATANMRPSAYPQFNSASWQNANFYNNPMSAYASPPTSFYYQPPPPPPSSVPQQNLSNNRVPNLSNLNNNTVAPATNTNNNIYKVNNNSINQYLINNQASNHLNHHHQQHIQMMRDFSSASPMDGGPLTASSAGPGYGYGNNRGLHPHPHQHQHHHHHHQQHQQQHGKSSQFGVSGSSKIAPSISLIPDLGFVAPAHTSFISVPKNSFAAAATKK